MDDEIEIAPDDIVRSVADAMRGLPRAEPTAAELVARQEWLEQCREAEERRRIQRHHDQLDAQAKAAAQERERQWRLEREAAIADAEARQRASREAMERSQSQRQMTGIYDRLRRAEEFRNQAVMLSRQHAAQQNRQAMLDDLQRDIDNLKPPPPPTVIVEQSEEDPPWKLGPGFDPKARRW